MILVLVAGCTDPSEKRVTVAEPVVASTSSGAIENAVNFSIRIVPFAAPDETVKVICAEGVIQIEKGDQVTKRSMTRAERAELNSLIDQLDEEVWSGAYVNAGVTDGYMVRCEIDRGKDHLQFTGSNGCPPGFARLLAEVRKIESVEFPGDWERNERMSKRYKSLDDAVKPDAG